MSDAPKRRRIYVVGGKGKNVPPWVTAAFDVEQFDQEHTRGREPNAANRPDAIVVLSSWVGHKHFYDGRDLAERLKIPLILSPGGWSASLKSAADLGAEWFIKDIENAKKSDSLDEKEVTDLSEFIDNAWREAYTREWAAKTALVKRHESVRLELELAKEALGVATSRQAAADRVIQEIRAAAAQQREALDIAQAETGRLAESIRSKSERLSNALGAQLKLIETLHDRAVDRSLELHRFAQEHSELAIGISLGLKELRSAIAEVEDPSQMAGAVDQTSNSDSAS